MLKYLVPKICATIPLVGGTVDNHKSPKVIPKIIEFINEGGEKISRDIEKRIEKYLASDLTPVATSDIGKAYRFDESGPRYIEFCKSTVCLLYTSPSPRDATLSRMPSSA